MKKLLALVLAMVMTLGLATVGASAKTTYPDASDIKYTEAVDVMTEIGVLGGDENGFRPGDELKRSEGAKIITYLMLGKDAAEQMTGGSKFSDVPASHWAAGYIEYLAVEGVVGGIGDGKFDPDGTLTTAQFAKMLLGALGYDANIEGFGGPDWMINVQSKAKTVGIFDSNTGAIATANVKRQEAALYSFNMIQKPLVEYENKGSTMSVNGATISFGASKASYVMNTAQANANYRHIDSKTFNVAGGGVMDIIEFAEEYYTKLVKNSTIDDFGRKSTKWIFDGKEIGTYAVSDQLIYTTTVTLGQIYKDLGLTGDTIVGKYASTDYDDEGDFVPAAVAGIAAGDTQTSWYFIDGVASNSVGADLTEAGVSTKLLVLKKESTTNIGGKGTETYVYYDNGTVRICVVNWYVGDVVGVYAATAKKEAYIDIAGKGVEVENGTLAQNDAEFGVTNKNTSGSKTTTGFAQDDVVIYTCSWKGKNGVSNGPSIGEVKKAEVIEGELNSFVTLGRESMAKRYSVGSVTIGGKKYEYSAKVANTPDGTFLREGIKLKVVLDKYGYAINVGDYGVQNYAIVVKQGVAGSFGDDPMVNLLLTDGTTTGAVKLSTYNTAHSVAVGTNTIYYGAVGGTQVNDGDIVTYTKAADGEYRLAFKSAKVSNNPPIIGFDTTGLIGQKLVTNGEYQLHAGFGTGASGRAGGKTVFLIKDSSGNYKVYNGIKEVPTVEITAVDTLTINSYAEKSTTAQVVYIDLGNGASMRSTDTIFVKFGSGVGHSIQSNGETAYELTAWVNGEEQTIRLNSAQGGTAGFVNGTTHYRMFASMTVNKNGIATLGDEKFPAYGSTALKNGSIGLGTGNYAVANPCKVFEIKDNDIIASSVNAIPTSTTTKLWFNRDSSDSVTYIFFTRDAVTSYTAADYAASTAATWEAFITAKLATIPNGDSINIVAPTVAITGDLQIPSTKRVVVSGDVTITDTNAGADNVTTIDVRGALEAKSLTLGTAAAAVATPTVKMTVLGTTDYPASVVTTNNIIVNGEGHIDVSNNGVLTAWTQSGAENVINGNSLEIQTLTSSAIFSGKTVLKGLMKIFAGSLSFGNGLEIDDTTSSGTARFTIGKTGSTAKITVDVKGGVTASTVTGTPSVLIEILSTGTGTGSDAGSVTLGNVNLGTGAGLTIAGTGATTDPTVSLGTVSGTGSLTNGSKNTTAEMVTLPTTNVNDTTNTLPVGEYFVHLDLSGLYSGVLKNASAVSENRTANKNTTLSVSAPEICTKADGTPAWYKQNDIYTQAGDSFVFTITITGSADELAIDTTNNKFNVNNWYLSPKSNNVVYMTKGDTMTKEFKDLKDIHDVATIDPATGKYRVTLNILHTLTASEL